MVEKVTRFPISGWERIKNRRGKRTVNCEISSRYLKYGQAHDSGTVSGVLVAVDVMTDNGEEEKPDRKICELVLSLGELKELVNKVESDIEREPT